MLHRDAFFQAHDHADLFVELADASLKQQSFVKFTIPLSGVLLIPEIEPFVQEWGEIVVVVGVVVAGCCSLLHRKAGMEHVKDSKLSPGVNAARISSVDQHNGVCRRAGCYQGAAGG